MQINRVVAVVGLGLSLTSGAALADYCPQNDLTLSLNAAPSLLSFSGSTGSTTFALQEAVHNTISQSTGTSVNHSYIWIMVNGKPVLAIDPMWVDYGKVTR